VQNSIKEKLNILFLCSWYPNRENPTLGNFVQKHAEAANRENNITVLAVISSTKISKTEVIQSTTNGLHEILVYYPRSQSKIPFFNKLLNFRRNQIAFKLGYQQAKKQFGKFDLLHLNVTYPLGIWAKRLKKSENLPYVITEHSNGFHLNGKHAYPPSILKMSASVFKEASCIMPVSEDLKNHLLKLASNVKYKVISNVVDETLFSIAKKEETKKTQFVHISTAYDEQKNVSGILNVFSKIAILRNDFELHIISDGDTSYAKKIVREQKNENFISFHSTKSTLEIASFLSQCDALVLFSNYENFPCVIAESFMSGIPVISTNINGIPEHVKDWNGILVEKGNDKELEKAIIDFLNKKLSVDSHKLRSYALEHFSYNAVGKSFNSIYRQVLKS